MAKGSGSWNWLIINSRYITMEKKMPITTRQMVTPMAQSQRTSLNRKKKKMEQGQEGERCIGSAAVCVCVCVCAHPIYHVSLSLTHSLTHTHTHTHSLSLCRSLTHTHTHTLSLSLSRSLTPMLCVSFLPPYARGIGHALHGMCRVPWKHPFLAMETKAVAGGQGKQPEPHDADKCQASVVLYRWQRTPKHDAKHCQRRHVFR